MSDNPKIRAVAVILFNEAGHILLSRRLSDNSRGTWGTPGGRVEAEETPENAAIRETKEETSLDISDVRILRVIDDSFQSNGKTFVTTFLTGRISGGELKNLEPEKHEDWKWFDLKDLPSPLMTPLQSFVNAGGLRLNQFAQTYHVATVEPT